MLCGLRDTVAKDVSSGNLLFLGLCKNAGQEGCGEIEWELS